MLGRALERWAGLRVYRRASLPWGFEFAIDAARRAGEVGFQTVFDVGANIGQSTLWLARAFPASTIWAFEPFDEPFNELSSVARSVNARCFKVALASREREVWAKPAAMSVNNSLRNVAEAGEGERIQVLTLDAFAAEHSVASIDFLKIDTEGLDLEVLEGAERLLSSGAVTFVQVEASMNRHNSKHVPLERLKNHLEGHAYSLFGLYEQTPEWSGEPRLRFVNAVFCSERILEP